MSLTLTIVIVVVVVALVFDFTNGFHDSSNAIATSIATRALTPGIAVGMAAIFNFVGAFLGERIAEAVAETIDPGSGRDALVIVLAALVGAIGWNVLTWYAGMPSSSSHALIGGLVGAALVAGATANWDVVVGQVVIPMIIVPFAGFALGFAAMAALLWVFRRANPTRANNGFRLAQTVSAAAMALGHGLQDAQKTMGVIFLALVAGGYASADDGLPFWVVVSAAAALSLGTYSGGWRIMRTLGRRLIDLDPPAGFAAESTGASVLYATAYVFEAPISTTHTIASTVVGAGATRRLNAIRWSVARRMLVTWVLTLPAAGLVAAAAYVVLAAVVPAG